MSGHVIRDRIMNADPQRVGSTLMCVIDTLQDKNINDQIQASACLFLMFATRFGLPVSELLAAAGKLFADTNVTELHAAREYINQEWY